MTEKYQRPPGEGPQPETMRGRRGARHGEGDPDRHNGRPRDRHRGRHRGRRARRLRLPSWLGLGLLAALAAWLLGRPRRPRRPRPAPSRDAAPPSGRRSRVDAGVAETELDAFWVPGPAGSLRVLERHPDAERALLFVHGLGGRAEHWQAQLAALGPALRGLALDLPGHGESEPLDDTGDDGDAGGNETGDALDALAAAIGAVLDAGGIRRAVLIGHSLGALAALRYAARAPARVAGVLLVDPTGDQTRQPEVEVAAAREAVRTEPFGTLADGYRQLLIGSPPALAARVLGDLEGCHPATLASAFEAASARSPVADLEAYRGPVRSLISPLNRQPWSLHRLHPGLEAVELGALGHWPMLEDPDRFNRELDAFLDLVRAHTPP